VAETPDRPPAVVLVGFMGAGKTAVGRALADCLGCAFVDTDASIVDTHGPVSEVFAARGEAGFRLLEAAVVVRELEGPADAPKVLALGGGAVLSDDVRRALARCAHVVWLTAPVETLWRRASDQGGRPLAGDEGAFRALLAAREPLYREVATMVVDAASGRPADVAAEIAGRLGGAVAAAEGAGRGGGAA
jgi:shikimate kinase